MNNYKNVLKHLNKETKVELETQKVELGIAQDLDSYVKNFNSSLDTADKVVEASVKVNVAIKKVEKDARYYNKYATIVYQDVTQNIKSIQSLMSKAENLAKELGVQPEEIDGYKKASNYIIDAKRTLNNLNKNPLNFDI